MDGFILQIVIFLLLFGCGFTFGRRIETRHLAELTEQEQLLAYIQVDNQRIQHSPYAGQMISSNVVISHDYFKYVLAYLHNLIGGRLLSYESVVERARREALIRLKQQAAALGATHILGLRLATTEMGMQGGMVEVFAYGTAIRVPT